MRQLSYDDTQAFIEFTDQNPSLYLFFKGDYLAYGFDHPDCNFYGLFRDDKLEVCLMRYKDSLHLAGNYLEKDKFSFVYDLFEEKRCQTFNTSQAFFDVIESFPFTMKVEPCTLSVFDKPFTEESNDSVELLDMKGAREFSKMIQEIFKIETDTEDFIDDHLQGRTISYCLKEDDVIVSGASVTALSDKAGMIVGVGTRQGFENKGYASRVVSHLCNEMMKDNRSTVLFYTNPVAGRIYHRIGFEDTEPYYLLRRMDVL